MAEHFAGCFQMQKFAWRQELQHEANEPSFGSLITQFIIQIKFSMLLIFVKIRSQTFEEISWKASTKSCMQPLCKF